MRSNKLRILFTHREMDTTVYQLARELAKQSSFDVYITAPNSTALHKADNINYLPIPDLSSKFSFAAIKQIRKYCKQYHFDVIYSVSSSGLSNALFASLGTKAINIAYRGTGAKVRRFDPTYYLGILNPRIKHIVCENRHIQNYLSQFISGEKLSTATKPFEPAWVAEAKSNPIVPNGAEQGLRIISVGNTKGRAHKGLRTLIEAINYLNDPSIQVILVGDYEDEDYHLAMESEVRNCYHFIGSSPQAMHYIAGADIYVLPSYRDASPRVLREAMALGLPTIVSDIEGSRDLIEEGVTGLLFEPRNHQDLAKQIQHLQANATLRKDMGKYGEERIRKVFPFSHYTEYFVELFHRLGYK